MIKIVLADDDKVTLRFLEHFLTGNMFSVSIAHDGQSALDLVQNLKPDILISDLVLPRIDGLNLCKRVKEEPGLKQTKIILMSAVYMGSALGPAARECGADSYVNKPIRTTELLEKIYKLQGETEDTEGTKKPL
jgi:DNA-binding response OmpR family regulator